MVFTWLAASVTQKFGGPSGLMQVVREFADPAQNDAAVRVL
jgi:hypothetical protein